MKKLFLFFLIQSALVTAQKIYEYPRLRIGVEAGFENSFGSNVKPSAIRESQSYYRYEYYNYDYFYGCGYLYDRPSFSRFYFGIKPEYSLNHRFVAATGLRILFGESSLTSDRDNFLWKIVETETSSNYLRIKSITQKVYTIGIPLELKFFTSQTDLFVRQYFKLGTNLNFNFTNNISVDFVNKNMNKYFSEIEKQFDKTDFFNGQLVLAIGLKIGRMRNPFGSIELQMPIYYTNSRLNALFDNENIVGFGMATTFYLPAGKQKLSYTYIR